MGDVVGVIVDHVEDDADACLVEGLHHLLELTDASRRGVGVGGVAALRHVVVHGVVAPVVLVVGKARLVHRAVVVAGQDVDGIHAKTPEVVDGPRLSEGKELARVGCIGSGDGEVAMVKLIDDMVGWRLHDGPAVALPPFGIGGCHVDDGATLAIDADGLGEHAGALALADVEGIEASHQVALHGGDPAVRLVREPHGYGLNSLAAKARFIDTHLDLLGIAGGKEAEGGGLRRIGHLIEVGVLSLQDSSHCLQHDQ